MNLNFRFGPLSRRTMRSIVRAIGPTEIGIIGLEDDVIDQIEAQLRRFPRLHRIGFIIGLSFVEWGGVLGVWGITPFSLLRRESATKRLYQLLNSRFKPVSHLVNGLRVLVCLSSYGRSDVEQWFGFERRRWRAQRLSTRAKLLRSTPDEVSMDRLMFHTHLPGQSSFPPTPEALYGSSDEERAKLLSWEAHQELESPFVVTHYVHEDETENLIEVQHEQ